MRRHLGTRNLDPRGLSDAPPWEVFLAERFPGYLLPHASRRALSEEAAERFLKRLGGRPEQLFLLRAASVVARQLKDVQELALRQLPDLARTLPRRAAAEQRVWEGKLPGRPDAAATLRGHLEGRRSRFVTRTPTRAVDRPEDVLVKAVVRRLVDTVRALAAAGLLAGSAAHPRVLGPAWGRDLTACGVALEQALTAGPLRGVSDALITSAHEQAAHAARHPAYALSVSLYRALCDGLDERDPALVARVLAEGALAPLRGPTRFELAVLLRLMEAMEQHLEARSPGRWTLRRTAVLPDRSDIADFEREGGAHVRLFYNQTCLPPGPHDAGVRWYFGHLGRLRPDISILIDAPGRPTRAAIIEAKLSSDPAYLVEGYREALLYREEYAACLTGWPKAILVTSSPVAPAPRLEDAVIAVGWDQWVPPVVLDGLLAEI